MRRTLLGLVGVMMVLALLFAPTAGTANAAEGTWAFPKGAPASYELVIVDQAAQSAPAWLQQFSGGIKISQAVKVCYTFRHGQFGWTPRFLQLKGSTWKSVVTTKEYLYGEEGSLFACAQPVEAGTYALFAYYSKSKETTATADSGGPLFTVGSWDITVDPVPDTTIAFSFGDVFANDVNWRGYPAATHLAWGILMCWDYGADCRENDYGTLAIGGMGYPQNHDVPIFTGSTGTFYFRPESGECRMVPFVELLDTDGNVLERIDFITEYANYCVS